MKTIQGMQIRGLLAMLQQACHLVLFLLLLLLSLNGLSAQTTRPRDQTSASSERRACSFFNSRNRNFTCHCSDFSVKCANINPPLIAVPIEIMKAVRSLELNNNSIQTIKRNDFLGLEQIQILMLQDNNISYIHPDAFQNLYRLEILNLANNRLGELDPSMRTFQHLSSLKTLSLQNNNITKIFKYSFFTLTASSSNVSVNLKENPIQCDCNVWALRSWEKIFPEGKIQIKNLICENDQQKRSYQEVDGSVFGSCNASFVSRFADTITCPTCRNERTNHGCKLQKWSTCSGETVCQRSVQWGASDKAMMISSHCATYKLCLMEEASNNNTCGIDFLTNKDVSCHFCCRGPTCAYDSIGGRTKDFTFHLSYIRSTATYEPFMSDKGDPQYLKEEDRIDTGIRNAINSLKGGIDVYLLQFIPQQNQQYQVVLRLEVTVFNTETEESVEKAIKDDILFSIQNTNSFFFGENIVPASLNMSSIRQESDQCPESVSYSLEKGNITWKSSSLGILQEPCPYQSPESPKLTYASRTCLKKSDGSTDWDEVNYSSCASKTKDENPDSDEIFDTPLSPENAQTVSTSLKMYVEQLNNFTVEAVNNVMHLLEQLLNDTMLQQPDVATNIVSSVSSLINIDQKELLELEPNTSISKRLLAVVDVISEKAPLKDEKLMIVTPNLAIAAQGVNTSETQDVTLTADSSSKGGLNNSKISVGFSNENISQLTGRTSMVIPVQAIIASATPEEKSKMNRISFAVHQSDKLFLTMGSKESREMQRVNATENNFCEKNNSSDCPKTNLHSFITKINSHVISASVPGVTVQNLNENITMSFVHNDVNATNPRCVFWNKYLSNGTGEWSDEGCGITVSYSGETTCGCNHLTNFALLMDVYQEGGTLSDLDRKVLSIISYVGCGISFFALLLTILSYSIFRSWRLSSGSYEVKSSGKNITELKLRRDNPSKILINLCVALLLTNLVYLVGMQDYAFDNTSSCKAVAVLLHYFLLSSLTWMAVEAFYMYLALVRVFKAYFSNFILKCSLVGWGVPLVIVVITLGISATENYGFINSGLCWLRNPAFYAAFVGPVCLILLMNCLAFGLVIKQLINISSSELSKSDRHSTIQRLRAAVGVVILLGLTWLFAIFAIGQASVVFYYLFAVFNSLQGLFIFIYHCLLKKDAFAAWKRLLPCFEDSGEMSKTSSNSKAMTSVAATHHRVNHDSNNRSESSTFLENTVSAASKPPDSDSYFNNVNTYDRSDDCDLPIITETVVDTSNYNKKTSPLLLPDPQDSPISRINELPSYMPPEYNAPSEDYNNTIEDSLAENMYNNTPSKSINSSSENQIVVLSDAHYSTAALSVSSCLPRPVTTAQHPSEKTNYNFTQPESPERSRSYSNHEEGMINPANLSSRAKGEIDYSSLATVSEIRQKLEEADSEATDKYVTHF